MNTVLLMLIGLGIFFLGYRFYSKFIAEKIFKLDPNFKTPAHEFKDGIDFLPANKHVLFGHHFTSVAGAAPIIGPAIAVIWGWLPAFLWVVIGSVFAGAVHDFGTLWVSNRHKGQSIGTLSENIINSRARILFLLIIFFLVVMVNAVFAFFIAKLFNSNPGTVLAVNIEIPLALLIGYLVYKKGMKLLIPSIAALIIMYVFVWLGSYEAFQIVLPFGENNLIVWIILLLVYAFIAASLPVWTLLQPRDYINSHQLFVALFVLYTGVLILQPDISAPAFNDVQSKGLDWFPFLFITIACGAISGFHGLVSSGTSSKQLNKETDARYVGYGGMIGEGSLALISILSCVAFFSIDNNWAVRYSGDFNPSNALSYFVSGAAGFATAWGIPQGVGEVFVGVMVISFAATSLDTSMRILKVVITEIAKEYKISFLQKGWIAALIGVTLSAVLALHDGKGQGGLAIWQLFGTTNQLTAGLSLLVVGLYLKMTKRPKAFILIPMIFLLSITTLVMFLNLGNYFHTEEYLLLTVGSIIFILELWLILEAVLAFRNIDLDHKKMA